MLHSSARRRGFTLVELMIVVAVIGIGGGLAVVNMSEQVAEARAQADGQAMLQRIRQEHRKSKERLTGMILHATGDSVPDGGGGVRSLKNVLVFQDARDCVAVGEPRTVTFSATTALDVTGRGTVCWNGDGEPADGRPIQENPGGQQIPPKDVPGIEEDFGPTGPTTPLPEPMHASALTSMKIKAGLKQIKVSPVYVSKTGISATPPITTLGVVSKKGLEPNDADIDLFD